MLEKCPKLVAAAKTASEPAHRLSFPKTMRKRRSEAAVPETSFYKA